MVYMTRHGRARPFEPPCPTGAIQVNTTRHSAVTPFVGAPGFESNERRGGPLTPCFVRTGAVACFCLVTGSLPPARAQVVEVTPPPFVRMFMDDFDVRVANATTSTFRVHFDEKQAMANPGETVRFGVKLLHGRERHIRLLATRCEHLPLRAAHPIPEWVQDEALVGSAAISDEFLAGNPSHGAVKRRASEAKRMLDGRAVPEREQMKQALDEWVRGVGRHGLKGTVRVCLGTQSTPEITLRLRDDGGPKRVLVYAIRPVADGFVLGQR